MKREAQRVSIYDSGEYWFPDNELEDIAEMRAILAEMDAEKEEPPRPTLIVRQAELPSAEEVKAIHERIDKLLAKAREEN